MKHHVSLARAPGVPTPVPARPPPARALGAAELAWALLALADAGIAVREVGWCLGPLAPQEVGLGPTGLERVTPGARLRLTQRRRRDRHVRRGHDHGCLHLGVPLPVLDRLLTAWGAPAAVGFVRGIGHEAVAELRGAGVGPLRGWSSAAAGETVDATVRRRITPRVPRLRASAPAGFRASAAQMPRFASNWPASRRFFTWVRKRAASAPSTMR